MNPTDRYPYPVARIGIVGGGQLGRMLVKAAKRLGCVCTVLDPTPNSPAGQVSERQIVADCHDPAALRALVESCDLTTFDLEDFDSATLTALSHQGWPIFPRPELLAVLQDKLLQKQALQAAGLPTAAFCPLPTPDPAHCAAFGYPVVQKARRGGYDGRGVVVMRGPEDFARHLPGPGLLERFVPAVKELAVIAVRGRDGVCRCYPPVEMRMHPEYHLLDWLLAPARVSEEVAAAAEALALRTIQTLEGVGVFGIEMFLTADGELLINEIAPRTHNSGHYTIEACVTDQFEQHLRAIVGLPLGDTALLAPAVTFNLLGAPGHTGPPVILGLRAALAIPGVAVHLYGKAVTRPWRKMGHVTVVDRTQEGALAKAEQVRAAIAIVAEEAA